MARTTNSPQRSVPNKAHHGPSVKHVVRGGSPKPNPQPAMRAMKGPLKGPKY